METIVLVTEAAARVFLPLLRCVRLEGIGSLRPKEARLVSGQRERRPWRRPTRVGIANFRGPKLTHAVWKHHAPDVLFRLTSRRRTVRDCFRCQKRIGVHAIILPRAETYRKPVLPLDSIRRTAEVWRARTPHRPLPEATRI